MNVRHETKQNVIHLYDFCAFGVYTLSHCTQTHDTGYQFSCSMHVRHVVFGIIW